MRAMARSRRLRGLGRLGQTGSSVTPWWMYPAAVAGGVFNLQSLPGPVGTLLQNALDNMATGNLTQDQVDSLKAQTTQSLIQTGLDPTTAAAQASQVIDQSLASATLPGAFGITWQGAGPSAPNWLEAGIEQTSIPAASSDVWTWLAQNWPWVALGAIGVWWVGKKL